jgi:hypothetical protein
VAQVGATLNVGDDDSDDISVTVDDDVGGFETGERKTRTCERLGQFLHSPQGRTSTTTYRGEVDSLGKYYMFYVFYKFSSSFLSM